MALFQTDDGQILETPDNFDPKTGENLAVKDALQKAAAKGKNIRPVMLFAHPDKPDDTVPVGYDEFQKASRNGLKPISQLESEKSAQIAANKVKSGDIGNSNDFLGTAASQFGEGATYGTLPNIAGAVEAAYQKIKGSPDTFSDLYDTNRKAAQSVLTSQEKDYPITSALTKGAGMGATGGLVPGAAELGLGGRLGYGAAQAAIEGGVEAANKDESLGDVAKQTGESGLGGLIGGGVGEGANFALKNVGNVIKPLIPSGTKDFFKTGLAKENYALPDFNQAISKEEYEVPHDIIDTMKRSKSEIGSKQGDIIKNLGENYVKNPIELDKIRKWDDINEQISNHRNEIQDALKNQPADLRFNPSEENIKDFYNNFKNSNGKTINDLKSEKDALWNDINQQGPAILQKNYLDHSDLYNSMKNAELKLLKLKMIDSDPDIQKDVGIGLNKLNGNLKTLDNTPNNSEAIQRVKENLGNFSYGDDNSIKSRDVINILKTPTDTARQILEDASSKVESKIPGYKDNELGNINKAYKAFIESEDPKAHLEQMYLKPTDIQEISKGMYMRPDVKNRWENFKSFVNEISNNPSVDQEIKNKMQDFLTRIPEVGRKARLMREYNDAHGISGVTNRVANQLGYGLSPLANIPPRVSKFLDENPNIAKLISISPEFANKILPAFGQGAGAGIAQGMDK